MSVKQINFVNFAKGYAILTIACFHALQRIDLAPILQKAIVFGGTGVHLFFVLSGLGLGLSKVTTIFSFYKRRLVKVWIPYVIALTISLVAAKVWQLFPDGVPEWLSGILLYQMFSSAQMESFGGHFWFISTIIQFYLIFPWLQGLQNRFSPQIFVWGSLAISVIWWFVVAGTGHGEERCWNSFFLQFLWEFCLGMAIARAYSRDEPLPIASFLQKHWWVNAVIGVVFTAVMIVMVTQMGETGKRFNDIPALAGYTALAYFIFRFLEQFLPILKRFVLWVSGFSFSLYLVHILALESWILMLQAFSIPLSVASILAFLPLALGAGWVFDRYVNRFA